MYKYRASPTVRSRDFIIPQIDNNDVAEGKYGVDYLGEAVIGAVRNGQTEEFTDTKICSKSYATALVKPR